MCTFCHCSVYYVAKEQELWYQNITTVFVDTRLWKTEHWRKRFQEFPSITRVIDMSDRNPPITATSVTFYVMLAGCDWWISIRRVDNTYDWRKFWKRFRECFVFQSRVSMKTVVTYMHGKLVQVRSFVIVNV